MKPKDRMAILQKIGQTTTTPTAPSQSTTIDIRSVPNFKDQLFSARPDIINDLNKVVNIINKYLLILSGNKINFNIVWNNPSITGSEFSNSAKNLVNISKWIYNIIRSTAGTPYSIEGLKQIATGLIATVKSYSFPEPNASNIQNELMVAGQMILSKLGGAQQV